MVKGRGKDAFWSEHVTGFEHDHLSVFSKSILYLCHHGLWSRCADLILYRFFLSDFTCGTRKAIS